MEVPDLNDAVLKSLGVTTGVTASKTKAARAKKKAAKTGSAEVLSPEVLEARDLAQLAKASVFDSQRAAANLEVIFPTITQAQKTKLLQVLRVAGTDGSELLEGAAQMSSGERKDALETIMSSLKNKTEITTQHYVTLSTGITPVGHNEGTGLGTTDDAVSRDVAGVVDDAADDAVALGGGTNPRVAAASTGTVEVPKPEDKKPGKTEKTPKVAVPLDPVDQAWETITKPGKGGSRVVVWDKFDDLPVPHQRAILQRYGSQMDFKASGYDAKTIAGLEAMAGEANVRRSERLREKLSLPDVPEPVVEPEQKAAATTAEQKKAAEEAATKLAELRKSRLDKVKTGRRFQSGQKLAADLLGLTDIMKAVETKGLTRLKHVGKFALGSIPGYMLLMGATGKLKNLYERSTGTDELGQRIELQRMMYDPAAINLRAAADEARTKRMMRLLAADPAKAAALNKQAAELQMRASGRLPTTVTVGGSLGQGPLDELLDQVGQPAGAELLEPM